jgi:hypothetical protein
MGSAYLRNLLYGVTALVGTTVGLAGAVFTTHGLASFLVLSVVVVSTVIFGLTSEGFLPVEGILGLVPGFRPADPQKIRESHHVNIMKRIEKEFETSRPTELERSTSKYSVRFQDQLCARAKRYKRRADMHWGRASSRRRFKAAWLYVTAADLYRQAGKNEEAANPYHWAANTFRELESFERSMQYYRASGMLGDEAWKLRCLQRALGVARLAGDLARAAELKIEVERLSKK